MLVTERDRKRQEIEDLAKEFHLTWKPWQKKVKLVWDIHKMFRELDVSWTQKDTADFLDYNYDHTSESCRLGQALEDKTAGDLIGDIVNRKKAIEMLRSVKKWKRI